MASKDLSNYLLLFKGDFAYNKSYSSDAPYGAVKQLIRYKNGVVSSLYFAFKINENINNNFVKYYFDSDKWHKNIYENAAEGARNHGLLNITAQDFFSGNLKISSSKFEQDKIGLLLSKLDSTITLLQQEVHLKTLLKRELLQRLLTNTENNVPKIRFKNYNDSWKNTTLEEVADIKTGSRNHQDSIKDGKYPFFVRSEKIEHLNEYDFNETAILVPGDGKIGEIFHYYQGKFALHQRVYKIDNFKNINSMFLLNLFKSNFRQHALRLNAQGTVPSLRLPMFTKWKIAFPTLSEQKQIAKLLNMVDTSIKAKKRRIKRLSMLKKFLLQNMFV